MSRWSRSQAAESAAMGSSNSVPLPGSPQKAMSLPVQSEKP